MTEETDAYWDRWMKQLRDPEAKPFYMTLENQKNSNERCCLGHACHALIPEKREGPTSEDPHVKYDGSSVFMPDSVARMLNTTNGVSFYRKVRSRGVDADCAQKLNDSKRFSLPEIAYILERERKAGNIRSFKDSDWRARGLWMQDK